MEKTGELVGSGRTSRVYEWGKDKVIKLYFEDFEKWISYEVKTGMAVYEAGVPAPILFDTVEVNGKRGIIYQRIKGKNMLSLIAKQPWKIATYARQMARLQAKFHQRTTDKLVSQTKRFSEFIINSETVLGKERTDLIINYLKTLPEGINICHGDFFPGNIIVSCKNACAVDWIAAYSGHPLGDVARTCLIFQSPSPVPNEPFLKRHIFNAMKKWMLRVYLNEYIQHTNVQSHDIKRWMLPVTAARIWENVPGERTWLLHMIDNQLKQLVSGIDYMSEREIGH